MARNKKKRISLGLLNLYSLLAPARLVVLRQSLLLLFVVVITTDYPGMSFIFRYPPPLSVLRGFEYFRSSADFLLL